MGFVEIAVVDFDIWFGERVERKEKMEERGGK